MSAYPEIAFTMHSAGDVVTSTLSKPRFAKEWEVKSSITGSSSSTRIRLPVFAVSFGVGSFEPSDAENAVDVSSSRRLIPKLFRRDNSSLPNHSLWTQDTSNHGWSTDDLLSPMMERSASSRVQEEDDDDSKRQVKSKGKRKSSMLVHYDEISSQ